MTVVLNLAWRVLIEEEKDNSLQFTKVFPSHCIWYIIFELFSGSQEAIPYTNTEVMLL